MFVLLIWSLFRWWQRQGEIISGTQMHEILREVDVNSNGVVELDEFLQLMACIKSGRVTNSRFDQLAQEAQKNAEEEEAKRKAIPVDRSGGGV